MWTSLCQPRIWMRTRNWVHKKPAICLRSGQKTVQWNKVWPNGLQYVLLGLLKVYIFMSICLHTGNSPFLLLPLYIWNSSILSSFLLFRKKLSGLSLSEVYFCAITHVLYFPLFSPTYLHDSFHESPFLFSEPLFAKVSLHQMLPVAQNREALTCWLQSIHCVSR